MKNQATGLLNVIKKKSFTTEKLENIERLLTYQISHTVNGISEICLVCCHLSTNALDMWSSELFVVVLTKLHPVI